MKLTSGDRVGAYRVAEPLGSGGAGSVYLAEHVSEFDQVALKVLGEGQMADPERFAREATVSASLHHRNIVRVKEVIAEPPALVMEFVEGSTLRQVLRQGRLPMQDVLDVGRGVLSGLAYLESKGLVHRDLKPANIVLERINGRLRPQIVDLGLVKAVYPDPDSPPMGPTIEGRSYGTPPYPSPEQIMSFADATPAMDVWAFGVVLYEMIAGYPPYDAGGFPELIRQHHTRSPDLSVLDAPEWIIAVVAGCLKHDPRDRPTASTLYERWRQAAPSRSADTPIARRLHGRVEAPPVPPPTATVPTTPPVDVPAQVPSPPNATAEPEFLSAPSMASEVMPETRVTTGTFSRRGAGVAITLMAGLLGALLVFLLCSGALAALSTSWASGWLDEAPPVPTVASHEPARTVAPVDPPTMTPERPVDEPPVTARKPLPAERARIAPSPEPPSPIPSRENAPDEGQGEADEDGEMPQAPTAEAEPEKRPVRIGWGGACTSGTVNGATVDHRGTISLAPGRVTLRCTNDRHRTYECSARLRPEATLLTLHRGEEECAQH